MQDKTRNLEHKEKKEKNLRDSLRNVKAEADKRDEIGGEKAAAIKLVPIINARDTSVSNGVEDQNALKVSINDTEHIMKRGNHGQQSSRSEDTTEAQDQTTLPTTASHPSMTPQERIWWAMSFEELYQLVKKKGDGRTGNEGRKSGRVQIIRQLCRREGITPWVAPFITPVSETAPVINTPITLPNGAVPHPEAILRTSDPALQVLIDKAEKDYLTWRAADLLELAMQRSYQLLKDSHGKLPSKSKSSMAKWLAAWDVLKSPREKKWWLGDGVDLVNRAKAMGYQGAASTKKYDVIVWLRTTSADIDIELPEIAEPTPNTVPRKHARVESAIPVSNRPAKGSKRSNGWDILKHP